MSGRLGERCSVDEHSAMIGSGFGAFVGHKHRFLLVVCLLVILASSGPAARAQDLVSTLEAEFLERFTRFIEWPSSSTVGDATVPFVIGVVDRGEVLEALERVAAKSKVKGKSLDVRAVASPGQAVTCNVVFVGAVGQDRFREIVAAVGNRPILVVSDSRGFAKRGSMINFITDGEFVQFELNPTAAEANGLRFAPELLALGQVVD